MTKPFLTKAFKAQLIDDNYVEGYASTYGNIDHANDVVERGAFTKTLQQNGQKVKFLWQHRVDTPIGFIEELKDTQQGLYFKARFSESTAGQDARLQLKEGIVDSFSIGYRVINSTKDRAPNGRPVNRLTELALVEISAVTFPCNEKATMVAVKSALEADFPELEADELDALFDEYQAFREMKAAQVEVEIKEAEPMQLEIAWEVSGTDAVVEAIDALEAALEAVEITASDTDSEQKAFDAELEAKWIEYQIQKRQRSRKMA